MNSFFCQVFHDFLYLIIVSLANFFSYFTPCFIKNLIQVIFFYHFLKLFVLEIFRLIQIFQFLSLRLDCIPKVMVKTNLGEIFICYSFYFICRAVTTFLLIFYDVIFYLDQIFEFHFFVFNEIFKII